MEVDLVAKDCIKPSSPTPHHLNTHKLSLLDQRLPPNQLITIILVYPFTQEPTTTAKTIAPFDLVSPRSQRLKQSLSQTLTHFYPLAGTLRDQASIECNDAGAYYVEARVKSPLSDHLNQLEQGPLVHHLPLGSRSHVTMIQQTNFACGGMVICATVSHMVADGPAFSSFLKAWASVARGSNPEDDNLCPNFHANAAIFKSHYNHEVTNFDTMRNFARTSIRLSRRFVFDEGSVSMLKAQAASPSLGGPTRVEVVSALLWRRLMAVFKAKRSGIHRPSGIAHVVNLRRRAGKLFSDNSPGNIGCSVTSICTREDPDLGSLASQIREAISKINGEFVTEIIGDGALPKIRERMREMRDEVSNDQVDYIIFTSWCNFSLYDVDFGWGKPLKAGPPGLRRAAVASPFRNVVILMDTRSGKGVEALVMLDEPDMMLLEKDQQLLSYAVMDPML